MKKIILVGRENLIDPTTNMIYADDKLERYNGIALGKERVIDDEDSPMNYADEMISEFERDNPNFNAYSYTIHIEKEKRIECIVKQNSSKQAPLENTEETDNG